MSSFKDGLISFFFHLTSSDSTVIRGDSTVSSSESTHINSNSTVSN